MGNILYLTKDMAKEFFDGIKLLKLRKMNHDQLALMFRTLLEGAFRISEVLALTPEDILDNGKLRIKNSKSGWKRCNCSKWKFRPTRLIHSKKNCGKCQGQGKYRVDQFGWIQADTLTKLRELADKTDSNKRLFPITRRQALRYIDEIIGSRTHALRHSWITWLLETEKFNIRDIKQKARHSTIQTTGKYIESNEDYTQAKESKVMQNPLDE